MKDQLPLNLQKLWLVTNITGARVSFDDKALEPGMATYVPKITDDIAAGIYNRKLEAVRAASDSALDNLIGSVNIYPGSLPVPVKLVDQYPCPEPVSVIDRNPVLVCFGKPCLVAEADTRRRQITMRNASSTATIAVGGSEVSLDTATRILPPGTFLTETLPAGAAWYATADQDDARLLVSTVVAHTRFM